MHPQVSAETLTVIIEQCYPQALAKGVDPVYGCVNLQDADGNTPLHEAAYSGCKETAKLLLKAGSHPKAQNLKGETPLFKAQYNKQQALIKLFKK